MMPKKMSRRDFIKLSAVVGTAAGLSGLSRFPGFSTGEVQAALTADNWIPTSCNMCGGTTGILVKVSNGRVIKIEPNSENPIGVTNISTDYTQMKASGARMCPKGNAGLMTLYDPDRVKKPLKRVGARGSGQWQEISYDQAVAEIASRLSDIKTKYGPDKLVWFTEDASLTAIQENFCSAYGTPNFLYHSNLCDVARKVAYKNTLGYDRPLPDLRNTKYMLIFGWNPLGAMKWAHLPRILMDGLQNGAKLVVVDPRCSETAEKCFDYQGRWLPIRPGTDGALALALANVIIQGNLYDTQFVANYTTGFAAYKSFVANKTPEWAAAITSIPADTIRQVARELATTKPAVIDVWSGPGQHMNGVEGGRAIAMLAGLLGQIDIPGTLIIPDRKGPKFRPGYNKTPITLPRVDGRGTKYPFAHSSGVYVEAREAMITGIPYQPRAAVFMFQNFMFSVPNTAKNIQALNNLDLIVSVDTHMSETALMADYVIPGSTYFERYELCTQWVTFPVVSLRQPVVPPVYGQKVEYEFVKDLAYQMGFVNYPFSVPYEQYLDEALLDGIGIGLNALKALPGATWIGGATSYRKYQNVVNGIAVGFGTPSKKFEFYSQQMLDKGLNPLPEYTPSEDGPTATYPFYLINWKEALHTHSRTMNNRWLMEFHGDNELWMNTDRARELGIADGNLVLVENQYGKANATVQVTQRIHRDVVGMTHGFGHWGLGPIAQGKGTNDGQFVPGKAERISGMAAHKDGAVRVSKVV